MFIDHPLEELLALLAHLRPVTDRDAYVGQDFENFLFQQLDLLRIRFLVDRESNERLELARFFARLCNSLDLAAPVANDTDDRMHGDMDSQPLADDRRKYRVDEKRHVV